MTGEHIVGLPGDAVSILQKYDYDLLSILNKCKYASFNSTEVRLWLDFSEYTKKNGKVSILQKYDYDL